MVSAYDPIESFFNSIQDVLSPLELRFQKTAKDFECCWGGSKKKDNRVESIAHFSGGDKKSGVRICNSKKKNGRCVFVGDERKKGLSIKVPIKALFAIFSQNSENGHRAELTDSELKDIELAKEHGSRINSLQYAVTWSLLVNSFVQAFPGPCESGKKWFQKANKDDKLCICSNQKANKDDKLCICSNQKANKDDKLCICSNQKVNKDDKLCICSNQKALADFKQRESKGQSNKTGQTKSVNPKDAKHGSLECLIGFAFDKLTQSLPKFGQGLQGDDYRNYDTSPSSSHFDHFKTLQGIMGCKADVNVFLGNMRFARVGSLPSGIVGVPSSVNEGDDAGNNEEVGGSSPQKLASGILSIPLSNVERLKSTLSTVSLTELIDLVQQMGRQSKDHPDKKKLFSVQDFFRYTEAEGMRFFEELDRDGDGHVTLEDLEVAMRRRKLPKRYANDLMRHTRSHIFSKSFGWKQFLSLMEQKEATILRAYTSLCLSESGMLHKSEILLSLKNAGLPSNEDNAVAVMRFLNADSKGSISYGHFRNFMLLLPSDRLQDDPQSVWFEAATVVAVPPPVEIPAGSVLRSALAGGLSCALSTALMHPVDTIKTRVQASTLSFPEIIAKLPQIGVQGLYRGSIPAILGQFSSHGLRTGIFEASRLILINFAPTLPDIQVQSLLSFCSTVLGTAMRIPCEVLKQRCQAGIFDNAGEAILGTWHQDGLKGFFRGTGATLCREVPFYVAGMGLYAESKKAVQLLLKRELEPWETVLVGALSGGLASVVTTPFDVMKTRMMTAPQGRPVSMSMVAFSILRHEGPLGLFKGAVPRFFWIAPLGAMNFAGYELLKKAMGGNEGIAVGDQLPQERAANSAG